MTDAKRTKPDDDPLPGVADAPVVEGADASLLELVDHLLDQGVVVSGEVIIGLAGVDLIYLRLSAVLCSAERVLPGARERLPSTKPGAAPPAPRRLHPPPGARGAPRGS